MSVGLTDKSALSSASISFIFTSKKLRCKRCRMEHVNLLYKDFQRFSIILSNEKHIIYIPPLSYWFLLKTFYDFVLNIWHEKNRIRRCKRCSYCSILSYTVKLKDTADHQIAKIIRVPRNKTNPKKIF